MNDHSRAIVIENPGGPEVLSLEDLKRLVPPDEYLNASFWPKADTQTTPPEAPDA